MVSNQQKSISSTKKPNTPTSVEKKYYINSEFDSNKKFVNMLIGSS